MKEQKALSVVPFTKRDDKLNDADIKDAIELLDASKEMLEKNEYIGVGIVMIHNDGRVFTNHSSGVYGRLWAMNAGIDFLKKRILELAEDE